MRRWLIAIALSALALVALRATLLRPAPLAVHAEPLVRGRVELTLTNTKAGTVTARRRARLSPGTSGKLVELAVERGQSVAAGALLLRLDDRLQRARLLGAERALAVAVARNDKACIAAARARQELERARQLAQGSGIVSADLLDERQSAHDLAEAECRVAASLVESARAEEELAQVELQQTELRAPFDGLVAEVGVELGEWITPSVPLLAAPDAIDVYDPGSLHVRAPMDEVDAAPLAAGLPARITIDSFPGQSFPGRVARVAPFVLDLEQQNRTLELEVELEDAAFARRLLPGTSADVEVILATHDDVLRVPAAALLEGERVLVLASGRLVERRLELGLRNWDWAEVLGGLEEGALVVVDLDREGLVPGARAVREGGANR